MLIALAMLLTFSSLVTAQNENKGGQPLSTSLTGAAEVPGPGDADGTGTARITLDQEKGQVCFELKVSNIATATAAHIHIGAAGQVGDGIAVVLSPPPANGTSKNCVSADKEVIKKIRQNPENYYVNVHNADFPAGAVRGQLSK